MLIDLADIAAIEGAGHDNAFQIRPEAREYVGNQRCLARARGRPGAARHRDPLSHHCRVLDKGPVRMALIGRQHRELQPAIAQRLAVGRVL